MNRRRFLLNSAALFCAPAIVKAENIMRVAEPKILIPDLELTPYSYNGRFVVFTHGKNKGQARMITSFDGTNVYAGDLGIITLDDAFQII